MSIRKILLAGILAGLVLFAWQGFSWMALPWHTATIHNLPEGQAVGELLKEAEIASGVYHHPGLPEAGQAPREWAASWQAGPVIPLMVVVAKGSDPWATSTFVRGLAIDLVLGLAAALLLALAAGSLPRYAQRLGFVAGLGVFAALASRLVDWNWFRFPLDYALVEALDLVVGLTLAGLVLAWFVRPKAA